MCPSITITQFLQTTVLWGIVSKAPSLYFHSQTYNYSKSYSILLDLLTWYIGRTHKLSTSTLNLSNFFIDPVLSLSHHPSHKTKTHYCPMSRLFWDSPDSIYLLTSSPELILYPLISTQFLLKSSPAIRCSTLTHLSKYTFELSPLLKSSSHSGRQSFLLARFPLTPPCSKHFRNEAKMINTTIWEKRR